MWWMKNCFLHCQFPAWGLIHLSIIAKLMEAPLSVAQVRVFPGEVLGEDFPYSFLLPYIQELYPNILEYLCHVYAHAFQLTIRLNWVLFPHFVQYCVMPDQVYTVLVYIHKCLPTTLKSRSSSYRLRNSDSHRFFILTSQSQNKSMGARMILRELCATEPPHCTDANTRSLHI